ncbi:MAG: aspartate-semialdehyde dehydrogenase [Deltaproteobacteria bacterium]|nr:aspartate-semialdehyde dehydrogenase [Deltaproteobacteria bacterium]
MRKKAAYTVAVVGATGAVGEEMIATLAQRQFPVARLVPLASDRSVGKQITWNGEDVAVEVLTKDAFRGVDIALFSAGTEISRDFAPLAAAAGAVVIDNSAAFRMEPDVPLVVPEVNAEAVAQWKARGIIANPNCSTIQLCVVLKPIHDRARLRRVVVATYQSVSGAGKPAMDELTDQVRGVFAGEEVPATVIPHPIAFNCVPQIDQFLPSGYTKEEWKVIEETKKILGDQTIRITATAVRVPVFVSHAEAVNIETERKLSAADARDLLRAAPGVVVIDDPATLQYPLQRDAAGTDPVFVGRLREDPSIPNGLDCWIVADNLRKGAALNAVEIAEILIQRYL